MRRAVKDGAGNVLQRIDYYPFGSVSTGWSSSTTPAQPSIRWRFSGKEIAGQSVGASAPAGTPAAAVGNPYLDFGARFYDPRTASWLSHDPLSEKYYGISPVVYCAGNPVNFLDSFGEDFYFLYSDGTITFGYYGDEEDDDYLIWGELGEDAYGPMVSIRVSDKNILKSLSQKNKKENLSHSVVSSSSELIDVFDFIVHHSSDREWAIASFRNEEVGIEYGMVQGKRGSSVSSPSDIEGLNERDMIAKIHTHEGYIQDPGASGYVAGSVTTYPTDRSNYDDLSKRLKSQGLRIPKHYVYEVPNGYISQYNSNSGNFNRTKYSLNLLKTYLIK